MLISNIGGQIDIAIYAEIAYKYGMSQKVTTDPVLLLAELEAKRAEIRAQDAEIEADIAAIERLRSRGLFSAGESPIPQKKVSPPKKASLYYGLGIAEAGMKELSIYGKPQKTKEILAAMEAEGFRLTSKDPLGALNWALRRRENKFGDVVLMGNATWGLTEWFSPEKVENYRSSRTVASGRDHDEHVQSTKDGMKFAKEQRGVRFGAKRKMTPEILNSVEQMLLAQRKVGDVAAEFKVSKATIYGFFTIGRRKGMQTVERRDAAKSNGESQPDLLTPSVETSVH